MDQEFEESNVSLQIKKKLEDPPEQFKQSSESVRSTTIYRTIILFILFGFYFLLFGIVELVTNNDQKIYYHQIVCPGGTHFCQSSTSQFLSFDNQQTISIYLSMPNVYEHDIYSALRTDPIFPYHLIDKTPFCGQFSTNQQLNKTLSVNRLPLQKNSPAIPCGYKSSLFPEANLKISVEGSIPLSINPPMLPENHYHQFQIKEQDLSQQWIDLNNSQFRSWIQTSASIKINKLWGSISQQVSGFYKFVYQFDQIQPSGTVIGLSLQNNQSLGGYNFELCSINFLFAVGMFLAASFSFILNKKNHLYQPPNKFSATFSVGCKQQSVVLSDEDFDDIASPAKLQNVSEGASPLKKSIANPLQPEVKIIKESNIKTAKVPRKKQQNGRDSSLSCVIRNSNEANTQKKKAIQRQNLIMKMKNRSSVGIGVKELL